MVSHHGARANNPDWLWKWLGKRRSKKEIHAVISANGGKHHPSLDVVAEAGAKFTVHQTCSHVKPAKSPRMAHPSVIRTFAGHTSEERWEIGREAWMSAYPRGQVCAFEIYQNGTVKVIWE